MSKVHKGVIVAGKDRDEAISRYMMALHGEGAGGYLSESGNVAVISEANSVIFNPVTGDNDMQVSSRVLHATNFLSESSVSDKVPAHYFVCESGCNQHIIASSDSLGQFCPVCSSALAEPTDLEEGSVVLAGCHGGKSTSEDDESDDEFLRTMDSEFYAENSDISCDELVGESTDDEIPDEFSLAAVEASLDDEMWSESSDDLDDLLSESEDEGLDEELELPEDDSEVEFDEEVPEDEDLATESTAEGIDEEFSLAAVEASLDYDAAMEELSLSADGEEVGSDESDDIEVPEMEEDTEVDLSDLDDEEGDDEDSEAPEDQGVVATASSYEGAVDKYFEIRGGKATVVKSSTNMFAIASDMEFDVNTDPFTGEAGVEVSTDEIELESVSSEMAEDLDVSYLMCSNSECGVHIISDNDMLFCPVCAADTIEPEEPEESDEESEEVDPEENDLSVLDAGEDTDNDTPEQRLTDGNEKALCTVLNFVSHDADVDHSKLEVSYCGNISGDNSWVAFYNGQPFAKATATDAANHRTIFDDPAYGNAVMAGAKQLGVAKILHEMGFKPVMTALAVTNSMKKNIVDKYLRGKVKDMEAEANAKVEQQVHDFMERYAVAVSTAAVGINKGFFKGITNPLKHAMWNSVSAVGVRNAEHLIDAVFKSHADEYHKALFAKASDLMAMTMEVQNEIAKAVSDSNYMEASVSSALEPASLDTRLEGLGTVVEQAPELRATASDSNVVNFDQQLRSAVASLGKR